MPGKYTQQVMIYIFLVTMLPWFVFILSTLKLVRVFFIGNGQGLGTDIIWMEKVTVLITASRICWCGGFILLGS